MFTLKRSRMKAATKLYLVCVVKNATMYGKSVELLETCYICTSMDDAQTLKERCGPRAVINVTTCDNCPVMAHSL